MSELFPADQVAMDSPKLKWLKRHGLETEHFENGGEECPETGDTIPHWVCRVIKLHPNFSSYSPRQIGSGDTEESACDSFAAKAEIKLWNEQ